MSSALLRFCCIATITFLGGLPAGAQTKPATSGKLSFHEPEMRRHRSGLHRPNAPRHHSYRRHSRHYGSYR